MRCDGQGPRQSPLLDFAALEGLADHDMIGAREHVGANAGAIDDRVLRHRGEDIGLAGKFLFHEADATRLQIRLEPGKKDRGLDQQGLVFQTGFAVPFERHPRQLHWLGNKAGHQPQHDLEIVRREAVKFDRSDTPKPWPMLALNVV